MEKPPKPVGEEWRERPDVTAVESFQEILTAHAVGSRIGLSHVREANVSSYRGNSSTNIHQLLLGGNERGRGNTSLDSIAMATSIIFLSSYAGRTFVLKTGCAWTVIDFSCLLYMTKIMSLYCYLKSHCTLFFLNS